MPMCSVHSSTACRLCLIEAVTVVPCLKKCQSDRMFVSIRSLTVLRVLRTMEQRGLANQALLFMVCGLHQKWKQPVTTSAVENTKASLLVRFLAHARILDCKLLPLPVTWVPTVSRP
jgi:hypothetical protein